MILYDNGTWVENFAKWTGTVWGAIAMPVFYMFVYNVAAYLLTLYLEFNLGSAGHTILGGAMSTLVIFRANQAYARYWEGRGYVSFFFSDLRDLSMLAMLYVRGGVGTTNWMFRRIVPGCQIENTSTGCVDEYDLKGTEARVAIARYILALAVGFKLHLRVCWDGYCFGAIDGENKFKFDWDRFRMRQLLRPDEFKLVDEVLGICDEKADDDPLEALAHQFKENQECPEDFPNEFKVDQSPNIRIPLIMLFYIREVVYRNLNDNANLCPWGMKERFVPVLNGLCSTSQKWYELMNQIITTPLPLPYTALCKTLLATFLLSFPFFIDYKLGWFANCVVPTMVCIALFGIDSIANELENPFGDEDNDLDILACISMLEHEVMEYMALAGDKSGLEHFQWRRLPGFIAGLSHLPLKRYLVVKDFAYPEEIIQPGDDEEEEFEEAPLVTTGLTSSAGITVPCTPDPEEEEQMALPDGENGDANGDENGADENVDDDKKKKKRKSKT